MSDELASLLSEKEKKIATLELENSDLKAKIADYEKLWAEANRWIPEEYTADGMVRIMNERDGYKMQLKLAQEDVEILRKINQELREEVQEMVRT